MKSKPIYLPIANDDISGIDETLSGNPSKAARIFPYIIIIIIIGIITTILQLAILHINGIIGFIVVYAGILMILGGAVGSCIVSSKARKFFAFVIDMFLQFI